MAGEVCARVSLHLLAESRAPLVVSLAMLGNKSRFQGVEAALESKLPLLDEKGFVARFTINAARYPTLSC